MNQVYSYIEAGGKSFIPPEMKGENASLPTYLMNINGRHYISVAGQIPTQPPEIKCEGPINLKAPENKDLALLLADKSEPNRTVKNARSREYPDIREQIAVIMDEFQRRKNAGEKLSDELSAMLTKIAETKIKHPKNSELGI